MPRGSGAASRWRFSYSILLPVFLAAIATLATVSTFIVWSTSRNDDAALSRQTNLVSHVLSDQRNLLIKEQKEVAAWRNAAAAVAGPLDMRFIEANLGIGLHQYYGHDRAYLLNPQLDPVYVMRNGATADRRIYETERQTIEPLARRLREIDWQGALAAFANGASEHIPNVNDVVLIEGQAAIVSLTPIVSADPNNQPSPGAEFIHVTTEFLDASLASELTNLLLLNGARFSTGSTTAGDEASLTIRNSAGEPIAYFAWAPDRPGARLFTETAPAIGGAVAVAGLIIAILMLRLRRSTAQLEAGQRVAQHMALHDALTGLGNRVMFEIRLGAAIAMIVPHDSKVALLLLDLDRFKQVNDTLGHDAGDELIRQVAERLKPLVRATDTIARLGGDEFAVILPDLHIEGGLQGLCDRILAALGKPFGLRAGLAHVGVSIGVALATSPEVNATDIARKADIALYEAKNGGRNRFRVFEERMYEVIKKRQALEDELRAALRTDDQLDVVFEPLVRENGTDIIGAIARVIWHHPERGEVPVEAFLSAAETSGLVEIIGEFALDRACQFGAANSSQPVAVRVYPAQLRNPGFFDKVISILEATRMQAGDLEIEIGEEMLSTTEETAAANLRKLRNCGVSISLGDFGIGFTSLRLLQQFQIERIKIDRSFIAELARSPDPEAITHAVVWLARAVGVEVSADGVDTPEQKKFLARMGCTSFQGRLFSPESQAGWLRVAANLEKNLGRKPEAGPPAPDIELWSRGS